MDNRSRFASAGLTDIADKLESGARLDLDDGRRLFDTPDLLAVGALANKEREKRQRQIATDDKGQQQPIP